MYATPPLGLTFYQLVIAYRKWKLTQSEFSMRLEIRPGGQC
jgi:hypothetical protein